MNLIMKGSPEVHAMNTFFFGQLSKSYEAVKRWTKNVRKTR